MSVSVARNSSGPSQEKITLATAAVRHSRSSAS